jgi:hypothetical protein
MVAQYKNANNMGIRYIKDRFDTIHLVLSG